MTADTKTKFSRYIVGLLNLNLWKLLLLCTLVGLIAGFGAILFFTLLDLFKHFFFDMMAGYRPSGPGGEPPMFEETTTPFRVWVLAILPVIGGLISGVIVFTWAPEAEGHGTDAAIKSFHHNGGKVRARVPFIKTITSAITIGSGGSAGREGPIAQIGAGFGSMLGGWLKLSSKDRRILMAAGMGAGVGAIFHAPLAGSLFAAEVLYKELDLEYEVILPAVISSIVAYAVFATQFGWDTLFITPAFTFTNPWQLVAYFFLALVVAGGSKIYVKVFYGVRDLFKKIHIPNHFKPAIGGIVVGCFAFFLPEAMGSGYGIIQNGFEQKVTLGIFLAVAFGKIITTSFSIGSGGSGGVFGPAIVIGGSLGGAVGVIAEQLFPGMGIHSGSFILVGMAGFFAAAANTPISTIIMVSEMTGNYHLLVPSMFVCFIAYALASKWTIYEEQIKNRLEASIHMGDMMEAVLNRFKVSAIIGNQKAEEIKTITPGTGVTKLLEIFSQSERTSLPVVDNENKLIGVVVGQHLRMIVNRPDLNPLLLASDLTQKPATVFLSNSLLDAVQTMTARGFEEVIVVDKKNPHKIVGLLSRGDIVGAYYGFLSQRMQDKRADAVSG